jgi:hypothetical protein
MQVGYRRGMFMPEVQMERSYRRALSIFADEINYCPGGPSGTSALFFKSDGREYCLSYSSGKSPEIMSVSTVLGPQFVATLRKEPELINRFNALHPCVKAHVDLRQGLILCSEHQLAGVNLIPSDEIIQAVLAPVVERLDVSSQYFTRLFLKDYWGQG